MQRCSHWCGGMRGSGGYTSQDERPHLTLSGGTMSSRERHSPPVRRVGGRQESSLFRALPLFGVDSKITIATTGLHMPCIVSDSAWASSRSDAPQPSFVNLWVKFAVSLSPKKKSRSKRSNGEAVQRPSGEGAGEAPLQASAGRAQTSRPSRGRKKELRARAHAHTRRRWADGLRHSTF